MTDCDLTPLTRFPLAKSRIPLNVQGDPRAVAPALRGLLGLHLKKIFCAHADFKSRDCPPCAHVRDCLYVAIFTPGAETGATPPRPFALSLSPEKAGIKLLELTLMGSLAVSHRDAVEAALTRAVQTLNRVEASGPIHPHPFEIQSPGQPLTLEEWIKALPPLDRNLTEFTFIAPVQLKRITRELTFPILVKTILSRLRDLKRTFPDTSHMGYTGPAFHQAAEGVALFPDLTRTRFSLTSSRTGRTLNLGGLTGSFILKGDLTPFTHLLASAHLLGLGRKTVYGLGSLTTPAWDHALGKTRLTPEEKTETIA